MQAALITPSPRAIPTGSITATRTTIPPHVRLVSVRASTEVAQSPPPAVKETAHKLNKYSSHVTEPKSQGGSQAILYGVGLSDEDMHKPQIGISSVWYEGNTCNMHLLKLSEAVKEGVRDAGMVGFRFNTVGVSDAISMGTRGMCYSLQSRDLIADSIETVMSAQWYDGNISIPGCDKNVSLFFGSLPFLFWVFVIVTKNVDFCISSSNFSPLDVYYCDKNVSYCAVFFVFSQLGIHDYDKNLQCCVYFCLIFIGFL